MSKSTIESEQFPSFRKVAVFRKWRNLERICLKVNNFRLEPLLFTLAIPKDQLYEAKSLNSPQVVTGTKKTRRVRENYSVVSEYETHHAPF